MFRVTTGNTAFAGGEVVRSAPTQQGGDVDWTQEAACRGMSPDLFFREDPNMAIAICSYCPVREDCYTYACKTGVDGVWGGTTYAQRAGEAEVLDNGVKVRYL